MAYILIVDDEEIIRRSLQRTLVLKGYSVKTASSGREATAALETVLPDLILMDIKMDTEDDGIIATRKIRQEFDRATLPIIVLSGIDDDNNRVEALKAGANDFIPKPWKDEELLARIETNLKVAQLTRNISQKNYLLEQEKALAGEVQRILLPQSFNFPFLETASFYRPSTELGGDFFDIFQVENRIVFLVGDVSGHGTSAALVMAATKSLINSQAQTRSGSIHTVDTVNGTLCGMLGTSGIFVTLAYGIFDPERNRLQMVSAGHNKSFLFRQDQVKTIEPTGLPLGWSPQSSWKFESESFLPGNKLFLYTDGIVEAKNSSKEQFGIHRLLTVLRARMDYSPGELIENAFQAANEFCNSRFGDDVTMLAIKRKA